MIHGWYSFHVIVATCVLASTMSSELRGWVSMHAYAQLSCVYLMSTLNVTHVKKMYQAFPLLSRESLRIRLFRILSQRMLIQNTE